MKKSLLFLLISISGFAQHKQSVRKNEETFNSSQALQEAKIKGIQPIDYPGYIEYKRKEWEIKNGIREDNHNHNPGMKIISLNASSTATNIDFETGDYTGWSTFSGENTLNSNGPLQSVLPMIPGYNDSIYGMFNNNCFNSDTSGRQGLISSSMGLDPLGGFPLASPMGGNYVARLNRYCQLFEGSVLQQTFTVSANQTWLNYAYAVVLEDGGHAQGDQTYFTAYVTDSAGNVLPCCVTYMQAANGQTPGFYLVNNPMYAATYYKPWTPVSIDLNAYVGQTLTINFIASACIYGGHSGYAYVDARLDSVASPTVVWPGDMNYDLTADMQDLLYLGWAYNANGPIRNPATNNWQAETSANWNQSGAYGVDYKHADANGSGLVDLNDTLALVNNFGLVHAYKLSNHNQTQSLRSINLIPSTTTINPGQTFYIDIDLSSSGLFPADTLFHINFNLNTPNGLISNMQSVDWSNSFVGVKNNNMTGLIKDLIVSNNKVAVGMVRLDHGNVTGSGNLLRLYFKAGNWSGIQNGNFTISDIVLTTHSGSTSSVNGGSVNLIFSDATTGISSSNKLKSITIYPNPSREIISIKGVNGKVKYEVVSLLGEVMLTSDHSIIDISSLANGNYFLRVNSVDGSTVKKFIKE